MRSLNVMHGFPVGCGLQKFFEITSFRTTISSACSPTDLTPLRMPYVGYGAQGDSGDIFLAEFFCVPTRDTVGEIRLTWN